MYNLESAHPPDGPKPTLQDLRPIVRQLEQENTELKETIQSLKRQNSELQTWKDSVQRHGCDAPLM